MTLSRAINRRKGLATIGAPPVVSEPVPGVPPVNLVPPSITGTMEDGQDFTLNVGTWSGDVDHFDVAWFDASDDSVILARDLADPDVDEAALGELVGKTIYARVWAVGAGGETAADTADFGPIAAAGDLLILALAWSRDVESLPSGWTAVDCGDADGLLPAGALYPQANPNDPALSWGHGGSGVATAAIAAVTTTGDGNLLQGRWNTNTTIVGHFLRIDLPQANVPYKIRMGQRVSSGTNAGNVVVRDGSTTGTVLLDTNIAITHSSTQVKDAAANVTDVATWRAGGAGADEFGAGAAVTITPTTTSLFIGRSATSGSPHLCCVSVHKVA